MENKAHLQNHLSPFLPQPVAPLAERSLFANADFFTAEACQPEPRQGFEAALFLTPPKINSKMSSPITAQQALLLSISRPSQRCDEALARDPALGEEELALALTVDLMRTINGNEALAAGGSDA